jgi:hypothetical protein
MSAMDVAKVRQCLNDTTLSDFAGPTLTRHPLQFFAQGLELRDASLNVFQMLLRNCIDCITTLVGVVRNSNNFSDVSERKTKIPAVPDELQPPEMTGAVSALIACRPGGLWQQTFIFIMTDNLDRAAALVGKASNRK